MTPNGTAGKDREDGQDSAERKLAGAAVGDGALGAEAIRALTAVPSNQRASDSHGDTRLGDDEGIDRRLRARDMQLASGATKRTSGLGRCGHRPRGAMRRAAAKVRTHHRLGTY